jgi:hypothetical protein
MTGPITTTQLFNRTSLAFLLSKEKSLEPQQISYLRTIYNNRNKKAIQGLHEVTYSLNNKTKAGKLGYGRLYGTKGGYETLKREIRGTMCQEFYYDIDVVNCHPVLLVQIAANYVKELPHTAAYNNNRTEYLAKISACKEEAKVELLKVMYGGKTTFEFLQPMWKELRAFTKFLMTLPRYTDLVEATKYEDNIYGSFLSYVVQTEEVKVMLAMKNSFERQGWSVDVLCYDGIMIRKSEEIELNDTVLRLAEKEISRDTAFAIELVSKPFTAYDVPDQNSVETVAEKVTLTQYNEMKAEFEKKHFYYSPTNTYAEVNIDGEIAFFEKIHATNALRDNWLFTHSSKFGDYTPFFPIWDKDPSRRVITHIDYKQSTSPTTFVKTLNFKFNEATGTAPAQALELFKKLVSINANNDAVLTDYLTNWIAHMIQKPFDLPGVAIVITGAKGAGKDTLGDFLINKVVGTHHAYNYQQNDQFFEKHDVERLDKFLIKLEEADAAICGKNESTLKSFITCHSNCVNPKGQKAITVPNYIRYMFTTNKAVPVNIGENERRFVLMRTDNSYVGNVEFWQKVRSELFESEDAGKAVADWLMSIDLSEFQVRVLPVNAYYEEMKADARSSEDVFIESAVWDGAEIGASELFDIYELFCKNAKMSHAQNVKTFGHRMAVLYRDNKLKRRTIQGLTMYSK